MDWRELMVEWLREGEFGFGNKDIIIVAEVVQLVLSAVNSSGLLRPSSSRCLYLRWML